MSPRPPPLRMSPRSTPFRMLSRSPLRMSPRPPPFRMLSRSPLRMSSRPPPVKRSSKSPPVRMLFKSLPSKSSSVLLPEPQVPPEFALEPSERSLPNARFPSPRKSLSEVSRVSRGLINVSAFVATSTKRSGCTSCPRTSVVHKTVTRQNATANIRQAVGL